MGQRDQAVDSGLMPVKVLPKCDQIEVTLFGPGYGECVLLHIGNGNWVIVDSCLDKQKESAALTYLCDLGLIPAEVVRLIVATHWHDDHIRGMGKLVEVCNTATFCCASALSRQEFLAAVGATARYPMSQAGSGMQELHSVFSLLRQRSSTPVYAIANRRIFSRDGCEVWALSPFDEEFDAFLQQVGRLIPKEGETKRRIPSLTPNKVAVVLLVKVGETIVLLGSDLEGQGWLKMLDVRERPNGKASVFKIPHHGSQNAHEDRVWNEMLHSEPVAALTPWRRGGRELPTRSDVERILSFTGKAYVTAANRHLVGRSIQGRNNAVIRTIRESGARIRRVGLSPGVVCLRKRFGSPTDWDIETLGSACRLADYQR